MKYIFLTLFTSFLINCNIFKNNEVSVISLERTACFGTCPVYKIEIFNNGNAIYNGKRFVEKKGMFNFKLSKKEIKNIFKMADKINFINLKNEYYKPISDLPTSYIKIKSKKIKNYSGAPKKLYDLENYIDSICKRKL